MVRLRECAPANGAELWLKLEYLNPTGSMKDRMALAMIEGAERDRLLSPGDTVVEYTGGSTGPGLALVCRAKGYRALIVMVDCYTEERFQLLQALGAEIEVVPSVEGRPRVTPQDIRNMIARAAELARRPGHYATDQFANPYIIPGHRDFLGPAVRSGQGRQRGHDRRRRGARDDPPPRARGGRLRRHLDGRQRRRRASARGAPRVQTR
jgi:cysteine synthase A